MKSSDEMLNAVHMTDEELYDLFMEEMRIEHELCCMENWKDYNDPDFIYEDSGDIDELPF